MFQFLSNSARRIIDYNMCIYYMYIYIQGVHSYNLYSNTVLGGFVRLFVRYRNHFPVVQFQN